MDNLDRDINNGSNGKKDRRGNKAPYPECFGSIEVYESEELKELKRIRVVLEEIREVMKRVIENV